MCVSFNRLESKYTIVESQLKRCKLYYTLPLKQFVPEILLYVCNIHPKAVLTLNLTLRQKPKKLGRAQLQALEKSKAVAGPQRIPLKINELGNDLGIGMGKVWCERSQIVLIVRF